MKIGLLDCDMKAGGTRFPNLAQMKMSAYCQQQLPEADVHLIYSDDELDELDSFDLLLVSKVFDFTKLPYQLKRLAKNLGHNMQELNGSVRDAVEALRTGRPVFSKLLIGGTGFFADGGRDLDEEVEHMMPDYALYLNWIDCRMSAGKPRAYFLDYLDAAIGYTSRGCFRQCSFCVNKKYTACKIASPITEFVDADCKVIFLLDDNFLALGDDRCEQIINKLNFTGRPFAFRQGLDIRLLNDRNAEMLAKAHWYKNYTFAFDHIQDKALIERKLTLWRAHSRKMTRLYVLCGFDNYTDDPKYALQGTQDEKDLQDLRNTFERVRILMKYNCMAYIMRYKAYQKSAYAGVYIQLASWCNQPKFFNRVTFRQYCYAGQSKLNSAPSASVRAFNKLEQDAPDIVADYADLQFTDLLCKHRKK